MSGLGEAALDRALADPAWLRDRLSDVDAGRQDRARWWAAAAIDRAGLQLCWATTEDGDAAKALERAVLDVLADSPHLWNRAR